MKNVLEYQNDSKLVKESKSIYSFILLPTFKKLLFNELQNDISFDRLNRYLTGLSDKLISFVFQGSSGFAQHVENCVDLAKYFEEQIRLRPSMFKPVLEEVHKFYTNAQLMAKYPFSGRISN